MNPLSSSFPPGWSGLHLMSGCSAAPPFGQDENFLKIWHVVSNRPELPVNGMVL